LQVLVELVELCRRGGLPAVRQAPRVAVQARRLRDERVWCQLEVASFKLKPGVPSSPRCIGAGGTG
jgi:hypothetical protein